MWRHNPGFKRIADILRNGWLGDVLQLRGFIGNRLAAEERPAWAAHPGGSLFEQGSHLIDLAVRVLGRPRRVHPVLQHAGPATDRLHDNNVAVLEFERAHAVISNTAVQSPAIPARSFEVIGTRGSALLQPLEPPRLLLELAEPAGPYPAGRQEIPLPPYRRYVDEFAELASAVRGERALSVDLEGELLTADTVLRASGL